jgi:hypothetical protein
VIPEIDIWRAATLMLKRYGDKALEQSATRADELAADGDHDGADTWRRITAAAARQHDTARTGTLTNGPVTTRHHPIRFTLDNRVFHE